MPPPPTLPPLLRVGHPVADRAVLAGDPGRALAIAQLLLGRPPRMSNHARGLWGYTGTASDAAPLSVLSTGTGGPAAAAVLRELVDDGVRRVVRAGSAAWVGAGPLPDGPLVVERAFGADGTTAALGRADEELLPDAATTARLRRSGLSATTVLSVDLLPEDGGPSPTVPPGVAAVDRQSAALLAAAGRLGIPAAVVLAFPRAGEDEETRAAWWRALGVAAGAAFGVVPVAGPA